MRRMFKALSVAIGAVSTLIVAITTLMFAFGKIPEAYEAACKFFLVQFATLGLTPSQ